MLDKVDKVAEMGVKNPKEDYTDVTLAVGDTFLDDFSGMVPPPTQEEQIQEDQIQEEQKQEGPKIGRTNIGSANIGRTNIRRNKFRKNKQEAQIQEE